MSGIRINSGAQPKAKSGAASAKASSGAKSSAEKPGTYDYVPKHAQVGKKGPPGMAWANQVNATRNMSLASPAAPRPKAASKLAAGTNAALNPATNPSVRPVTGMGARLRQGIETLRQKATSAWSRLSPQSKTENRMASAMGTVRPKSSPAPAAGTAVNAQAPHPPVPKASTAARTSQPASNPPSGTPVKSAPTAEQQPRLWRKERENILYGERAKPGPLSPERKAEIKKQLAASSREGIRMKPSTTPGTHELRPESAATASMSPTNGGGMRMGMGGSSAPEEQVRRPSTLGEKFRARVEAMNIKAHGNASWDGTYQ
jgi:hypothetical protein